jgi:eukaryotic-like serine/threonine-protein kinase
MPAAGSRRRRVVPDGGLVSSNDHRRIGGRYELVSRIARGGGGTVWRAEDTVLGRAVAVKAVEVPDELTPDERHRARNRVLQEARAAARLDHPAAVVVHDVLDDEDRLHLVMELVEAPTLRQRVQRGGPLSEAEAAEIGLGLTDVLAIAHERGIVHRDVKPSNIFVYPDGGVKLADFGIAALAGEASLTRTGTALGSPSYLAPEQARGEQASPAADVWGLGASLYYAVEGEPPFERGNAIATVNAVVHEPARAFQRADDLRALLGSLLSKDPTDRPSLAETEQALRALTPAAASPPATAPAPTERLEPIDTDPGTSPAAAPAGPDGSAGSDPPPAAVPASTEAEVAPAATDEEDAPRRRRALAVLGSLAAVVLLVVGAVVVLDGPGDLDDGLTAEVGPDAGTEDDTDTVDDGPADDPDADDPDAEDPGADEGPAGDDGAGEPTDGAEDDAAGADGTDTDGPATGDDGRLEIPETDVPDDWQVVEGATYRVAIPPGWQERAGAGNLTDYVDPDSGAYLRVDWTDDPASDPVADWEANEQGFSQRQSDYERIRLEPATFRGEDAALWEYTYTDGGASLHAVNLNLLSGDRAYALNLQSPAGDWEEVGGMFPVFTGGFEPAG